MFINCMCLSSPPPNMYTTRIQIKFKFSMKYYCVFKLYVCFSIFCLLLSACPCLVLLRHSHRVQKFQLVRALNIFLNSDFSFLYFFSIENENEKSGSPGLVGQWAFFQHCYSGGSSGLMQFGEFSLHDAGHLLQDGQPLVQVKIGHSSFAS